MNGVRFGERSVLKLVKEKCVKNVLLKEGMFGEKIIGRIGQEDVPYIKPPTEILFTGIRI